MQKIPTLFFRSGLDLSLVTNTVNPECGWVLEGEGIPTVQYDGVPTLVEKGQLFKHYDGEPSWVPVDFDNADDGCYKEAWERTLDLDGSTVLEDKSYELVGPGLQGNPYALEEHQLWPHGVTFRQYSPDFDIEPPRDYDGLREWFESWRNVEGIVWWHPDGRMAKIKRRDFGLPWPLRSHAESQ